MTQSNLESTPNNNHFRHQNKHMTRLNNDQKSKAIEQQQTLMFNFHAPQVIILSALIEPKINLLTDHSNYNF